ncbi:MAG: YCF48-related protein [bacterium]
MNQNEGWVTGMSGILLHTTDAGETWNNVNLGVESTEHLYTVKFLNEDVGWIAGHHSIMRTINGGQQWSIVMNSDVIMRTSLYPISDSVAWIVGCEYGKLYHFKYTFHANGTISKNWWMRTISSDVYFNCIYFGDENTGWSVGLSGNIVKITNAASDSPSFNNQISGTTSALRGVHMADVNEGWIVGDQGTILHTIDGGTNWVTQVSGTTNNLYSVQFIDKNIGYIVGNASTILRTINGGSKWEIDTMANFENLRSVFVVDSMTAWAVGQDRSINKRFYVPDTPTLLSPSKGIEDQPLDLTLNWNTSDRAVSYSLQVSIASDFSSTILDESGISSTSKVLSGLANGTEYFWRVCASNSGGTSEWSEAWNITTVPAIPDSPILLSPLNGAENQSLDLTLTWNASDRAVSYSLQVSTASDFSSTILDESGISSTSNVLSGLANGTEYFWRVCASNSGGTSEWSEIWNLTIISIVGIYEISSQEQVRIYPNPASDIINFEGIEHEFVNISIFSLDGILLKQINGEGVKIIDIFDLPDGIYIIQIINYNRIFTQKLVKN